MKRQTLRILTGIFAGATAITAVLATPALGALIPETYAVWLGIGTGSLLAIKEVAVVIGDFLDDGTRNNSFKP